MPAYRSDGRRGRARRLKKMIADLYKEGKCRECSVKVTRMDFAKILGKFTKVKIQYESANKPETVAKKVTSPVGNARLRSNENGMVLIHRSAYREHPAKPEPVKPEVTLTPARKRGRPPKNKPVIELPTVTQYRIVFLESRQSKETTGQPTDINVAELLTALTSDVLPTTEWLMDYLLHDEPTNDRVYDQIAAQLEDLMNDNKPSAAETTTTSETKTDEFPSIMELLSDPAEPSDNKENSENAQEKDKTDETMKNNSINEESKSAETKSDQNNEDMEVDTPVAAETQETNKSKQPLVNGNTPLMGENNVNIESINCIIFKKVKDEKCNRLVKCSTDLNYSIEIDGRPVELLGAPKYVSCVDDIRLMLQIVDECDLNSFNVVQGG